MFKAIRTLKKRTNLSSILKKIPREKIEIDENGTIYINGTEFSDLVKEEKKEKVIIYENIEIYNMEGEYQERSNDKMDWSDYYFDISFDFKVRENDEVIYTGNFNKRYETMYDRNEIVTDEEEMSMYDTEGNGVDDLRQEIQDELSDIAHNHAYEFT